MTKPLFFFIALLLVGIVAFGALQVYPSLAYSQDRISLTDQSGIFNLSQQVGTYYGQNFQTDTLADATTSTNVLGVTQEHKRIEVDLTNQRLYAFEGDNKVYDFLISSGKWGRTPTGTFRIWIKLRYTKMSGGSKELGTYYYLPNVPYTMFFSNDQVPAYRGFGIHGTYWHSNFGHPMSHGCINMKTEEAEKIFYWANPTLGDKPSIKATAENPGTQVIIYGTAPSN